MKVTTKEDRLLATHISENCEFEYACATGDARKIMKIVHTEMDRNNLYTKGSVKLRDDIFRLTKGKDRVSTFDGNGILMFVWNARLSGTGFAVCK